MVHKRSTVLIVDDDKSVCDFIYEGLAEEGYVCSVASNADDALSKLQGQSFEVVLLDIKLPGISGMDLLKTIGKCYQMTAIVMVTGVNDVHTAVEAMKLGASDYVIKPFTLDKLKASIDTAQKRGEPKRMVYNTIHSLRDNEYNNNAISYSLSRIDAIAYGVDARIDYFDFHSNIVTNKTIELARSLGLPDEEIEEWASARDELYSKRNGVIRSALKKLEGNLMAQVILGLTTTAYQFPKSGEEQN